MMLFPQTPTWLTSSHSSKLCSMITSAMWLFSWPNCKQKLFPCPALPSTPSLHLPGWCLPPCGTLHTSQALPLLWISWAQVWGPQGKDFGRLPCCHISSTYKSVWNKRWWVSKWREHIAMGLCHFVGVLWIRVSHTKDTILKSMQCIILVTRFICTCLFVNVNTLQSKLLGLLLCAFFSHCKNKWLWIHITFSTTLSNRWQTTFPLFYVK